MYLQRSDLQKLKEAGQESSFPDGQIDKERQKIGTIGLDLNFYTTLFT